MTKRGRFAKTMSFLVKHSWTADGDDTTTKRREPTLREKIGPYFCERLRNVRWRGSLRRWRWPRIGRAKGLGGRFLRLDRVNLAVTRSRKKAESNEYIKICSIMGFASCISSCIIIYYKGASMKRQSIYSPRKTTVRSGPNSIDTVCFWALTVN